MRDRYPVALDLPVERIAADLELCRDQCDVPMILFDDLMQRLALGALERYAIAFMLRCRTTSDGHASVLNDSDNP